MFKVFGARGRFFFQEGFQTDLHEQEGPARAVGTLPLPEQLFLKDGFAAEFFSRGWRGEESDGA
jgi:hypothetical protein